MTLISAGSARCIFHFQVKQFPTKPLWGQKHSPCVLRISLKRSDTALVSCHFWTCTHSWELGWGIGEAFAHSPLKLWVWKISLKNYLRLNSCVAGIVRTVGPGSDGRFLAHAANRQMCLPWENDKNRWWHAMKCFDKWGRETALDRFQWGHRK